MQIPIIYSMFCNWGIIFKTTSLRNKSEIGFFSGLYNENYNIDTFLITIFCFTPILLFLYFILNINKQTVQRKQIVFHTSHSTFLKLDHLIELSLLLILCVVPAERRTTRNLQTICIMNDVEIC